MQNRRWAIIAGLAVVELWIIGLILRSISGGGHGAAAAEQAQPFAPSAAVSAHDVRTVEAGAHPSVVIDDGDAALNVTVRPGVTVSVSERTEHHGWARFKPIEISKSSDSVRISQGSCGLDMMFGSVARQLDVVVPPGARLDVRNAGSTTISGLRAGAAIHTDSGTVMVSDHRGDLHVTTDDGRIELSDIEAPLLETHSSDGRIRLERVRADRAIVMTDNGRIEVARSLLRGGTVQTDSGRIALGLDAHSNVTLTARASSGKILAQPPFVATPAGAEDEAFTTVRIGDGSGRLDVASDDGSISIQPEGV